MYQIIQFELKQKFMQIHHEMLSKLNNITLFFKTKNLDGIQKVKLVLLVYEILVQLVI